ncbi:hypothetical protein HZ326_24515 [Fusarium oxysporum f. sp. albedinis]|nr:hypothetical protein HZ326_24515 [Fusarium oxysporum f. sp. albedinis]
MRNESGHEVVKRVAETKLAPGTRILRDDLYPIRVDNVSRIAVLDERNEVRAEATRTLGRENDTEVAKRGDQSKGYNSQWNKGRPTEWEKATRWSWWVFKEDGPSSTQKTHSSATISCRGKKPACWHNSELGWHD